eukprot:1172829-Pyramimonas_sp.AAC.2
MPITSTLMPITATMMPITSTQMPLITYIPMSITSTPMPKRMSRGGHEDWILRARSVSAFACGGRRSHSHGAPLPDVIGPS